MFSDSPGVIAESRPNNAFRTQHGVAANNHWRLKMWNTPAYCEIRLGFEVTAYVYVR